MGREVDLLVNYPRTVRDIEKRADEKSEEDKAVARQFGRDFFDGDRCYGYGGFSYQERFWQPVAPTFRSHYGMGDGYSLLDVGCAKGFMMHDFSELVTGIHVRGIDVSAYAIEHAIEDMREYVQVADAREIPYGNGSFDLVVSINTIHNLERDDLVIALREIERVKRGDAFITVDAYRNDEERELMMAWNLTAKTILHVDDWIELFEEAGYTGDYNWFMP